MPRWWVGPAAFALLIAMTATGSAGATRPGLGGEVGTMIDGVGPECTELVPEAHSVPGATDDGSEIVLEVLVVLDDMPLPQGQKIMEAAAKPYREIGIRLDPTYLSVSLPPEGYLDDGTPHIGPPTAMELTRELTGGLRPYDIDLVYTMTSKELSGGATNSVAGQADCIGGVRKGSTAFAVGEANVEPRSYEDHQSSAIAGHELAHLMGAHHHYANCAQGDPEEAVRHLSGCTLMFPEVFFASLRFSSVEAAVVRGHGLVYANETPKGTPPPAPRTIDLYVRKKYVEGDVWMPRYAKACFDGVTVDLLRKQGESWTSVASATTDEQGAYEIEIELPKGRYIATTAPVVGNDGESWMECSAAESEVVKKKR